MRIIKFALPLAAMVCFGPLGISAKETGSSSAKSRSSESGARKKSSSSKKSVKARKATKSSKAKNRQAAGKGKTKVARSAGGNGGWQEWADRLPPEELPEVEDTADDEAPDAEAEP